MCCISELPRLEMLALTGKQIEGEVLTAIQVSPKTDAQQNVWEKYKKHVIYLHSLYFLQISFYV